MQLNFCRFLFRYAFIYGLLLLSGTTGRAQQQRKPLPFDSSYYKTYPRLITTRLFLSRKYTSLRMEAPAPVRALRYQPNNALNLGAGVTYGAVSANVGVPLRFLDPDSREKGKTRSLDLQTHIYARKWIGDLYGQFYKGYFLLPKGYAADNEQYYTRPDLKIRLLGGALYRVMNERKFSYRAPFLQNEWQKRSAGSLLLGGELYHGVLKGDSVLVPSSLADFYPQHDTRRVRFIEVGPGGGYAYTYVYREHFFATGSFTLNGDLSFVKETLDDNTVKNRFSVSPNLIFRIVAGYNSDTWAANISWVGNRIAVSGASSDYKYAVATGNYRLTVARRFNPKGILRKRIREVEEKWPILSTEGK